MLFCFSWFVDLYIRFAINILDSIAYVFVFFVETSQFSIVYGINVIIDNDPLVINTHETQPNHSNEFTISPKRVEGRELEQTCRAYWILHNDSEIIANINELRVYVMVLWCLLWWLLQSWPRFKIKSTIIWGFRHLLLCSVLPTTEILGSKHTMDIQNDFSNKSSTTWKQ